MIYFLVRFSTVTLSPGVYIEYHTPHGGALEKSIELQNYHTTSFVDTMHRQHAPVRTSMWQLLRSIKWAERVCSLDPTSTCCSRAPSNDYVACCRDQLACVTGTGAIGTTTATPPPTAMPSRNNRCRYRE